MKAEEDVIELKRIIEQKSIRISQLEFELNQVNLRINLQPTSPKAIIQNQKCFECEKYKGIIRELEIRCNNLN